MNKTLKTFVAVLAIVLMLTFGLSTAYGQNTEGNNSSLQFQEDNGNRIVGTWISDVTIRNCQTNAPLITVKALNTFNQGGTMTETGNSFTRGPGHGTWERTKGNDYDSVFMFFRFNADGTYGGYQKVRRHHTLDLDSAILTTDAAIEVYNAAGVLIAIGCASETARRLE